MPVSSLSDGRAKQRYQEPFLHRDTGRGKAQVLAPCVLAVHNGEEIGPRMLAHLAKHTGLKPDDL